MMNETISTSNWDILIIILTASVITFTLRGAPLFAMKTLEIASFFFYLKKRMPVGIMLLLVAYTFKGTSFAVFPYDDGHPMLLALGLIVLVYVVTHNPILSMLSGWLSYLLIVNAHFI